MRKIKIGGMSCQHCVKSVTEALESIDGITNVQVSLEKGEATFDEEKPVDRRILTEAVKKIGFVAEEN